MRSTVWEWTIQELAAKVALALSKGQIGDIAPPVGP